MVLRDGRVVASAALAATVVLGLVAGPALLSNPSALAALTGRSSGDLKLTSQNRKVAWVAAARRWEKRPVLGYGPGQSSVRLAYRPDPIAAGRTSAPVVLGSAQGVWAAALIDAGVVGFCAWIALFGSLLVVGARTAWHERGTRLMLILWAAASAVGVSEFTGDRVDIRVWLALGVLAATSQLSARDEADQRQRDQQRDLGRSQAPRAARPPSGRIGAGRLAG